LSCETVHVPYDETRCRGLLGRAGNGHPVDLGLLTEGTARRLKQLYRDNRAAAYYRGTVASVQQADAMFDLAVVIHDHVTDFTRFSHECRCRE
jgi:hypothetical protein